MKSSHTLFSFRRCPYAIRARLALAVSEIEYEHCEVQLRDKPEAMLIASPKGTVPVLVLSGGRVIDESLDIMLWALQQHDPEHWLPIAGKNPDTKAENIMGLIQQNDFEFKPWLDRYKYSDRYLENSEEFYRQKGEEFIGELETLLSEQSFLFGDSITLADMAIAPFVRQFAHVDREWFFATRYSGVIKWLNRFLESERFLLVMKKRV